MCQVWLKLAHWFWRRRFFKVCRCIFCYFIIISPWERAWSFIWINMNPFHSRRLCAKFGWNWPSWFWRKGEKVYDNNEVNGQQTNFNQKSSFETDKNIKENLKLFLYIVDTLMVYLPTGVSSRILTLLISLTKVGGVWPLAAKSKYFNITLIICLNFSETQCKLIANSWTLLYNDWKII